MRTSTVLTMGATGKVGRRLVPHLRLRGYDVRPAHRSSRTPFDWTDVNTWRPALTATDRAYVVAPPAVGPMWDFLSAAAESGLRRLVLLSGRGADTWGDSEFGIEMVDAEKAVRSSGLEWTIVRASNFSQNFDEDLFHAPLLEGELALPTQAVPEPFVDVEDVAEVIATVVGDGDAHLGKTYELTGPRAVTFEEAVDLIARATGRSLAFREVGVSDYVESLIAKDWDRDIAASVGEMFVLMNRGLISSTTTDVSDVVGHEARSFEDYVIRSAARDAWGR